MLTVFEVNVFSTVDDGTQGVTQDVTQGVTQGDTQDDTQGDTQGDSGHWEIEKQVKYG